MVIEARDALLDRVVTVLQADRRFVAAWLAGSIASSTADEWSDLDLYTVVRDTDYEAVKGERASLFRRFGPPSLVQEIRDNALAKTFFALIIYPSGLELDFSLLPLSLAHRHPQTVVLFDEVGIEPVLDGLPPLEEARLQLEFFWAMALVAVKCAARRNSAHAAGMIGLMTGAFDVLWRLVNQPGERHPEALARRHRRPNPALTEVTPQLGEVIDPAAALQVIGDLCSQTALLHPALEDMGVPVPSLMPAEMETLIRRAWLTVTKA
ncbi:MAG: aminoglycoside 6-adenylyltransferase [Candidatus Dormibacteraeota bacterium]|nr:aminoglycoside 6-adenylyltransferase [Candidatus Dormibacteraeota bacterium]